MAYRRSDNELSVDEKPALGFVADAKFPRGGRGNFPADQFVSQLDAARSRELSSIGEGAAYASAARRERLADTLSPLPSTATAFTIDGAHAIHFLRKRQGFRGGFDYCARMDLPGVLPAFHLVGGFGDDSDARDFGPKQRLANEVLDRRVVARTRAPDVLQAFASDVVANSFPAAATRIALVQHGASLSVLEVDIDVGDGRHSESAAQVASQFGHIALALVRNNAIFTEHAKDTRPPAEQLQSLLTLLSTSTSWLSGPTERIGDGVEARLQLDEQPELPCALRLDVHGVTGLVTLYLRAPLKVTPTKMTRLSPQEHFFEKLRGLVDGKVGDDVFDDAWIIDGDVDNARVLQRAEGELSALRRINATIEWGAEGLVVRAPGFAFDGDDVADAVDASLRLWRALVLRGHGVSDAS